MGRKFASIDKDRIVVAFYDSSLHSTPSDAEVVEIGDRDYHTLLDGQARGKRMSIDADGLPLLLDPLPLTDKQREVDMRAARDAALTGTDWLVARHQDELMSGGETTLTQAQLDALLAYRKALRDLPSGEGWPSVDLPVSPELTGAGV